MKRTILAITIVVLVGILLVFNYGIEIGNIRIGKQMDLKTPQLEQFENSSFAKDYYSSENLIVLNVWATWCKPCIAEMPELNKIKSNYKDENIDFLSLSVDNDSIKLTKFLNTDTFDFVDITFENLEYRTAILNKLAGRPTGKHILSYTVPITYLIKKENILAKLEGTTDFSELKTLIDKHTK